MLTINKYVKVKNLEEAWVLNQNKKNHILGGMLWLKMSDITIPTAIDLSGLGLDTIEETDEEFMIGCMVSLRQLETNPSLQNYSNNTIKEALRHIVGVQFRNLATVGGSIYGRYGFSDVLTLLLSMDTYVELYKGGIVPLKEFIHMPDDRDILVRIRIKKTKGKFYYASVRNSKTDFPVIAVACSSMNGKYHFSIGARPGKAILFEKNDNEKLDIEAFVKEVPTSSNLRASAEYRSHLIKVLVQRALQQLGVES